MKKRILIIALFLMIPLFTQQTKSKAAELALTAENFPDVQVLKKVKKADKDGNGILSQAEINSITEISVGKKEKPINIKNLSLLPNIKIVSITGKKIDNLDEVYKLGKCEELELDDYSAVEHMDFSCMQSLKKIWISYGSIRKLILNNANLQDATIQITDIQNTEPIDISGNTKLEKLSLADRTYERVQLSGNNYIKELELDGGMISRLEVSNMDNLDTLRLPWFNDELKKLKVMDCPQLSLIETNTMDKLTDVEIKNIPLLAGISINAKKLKKLDLSPFTKLEGITVESSALTGLKLPKKAPVDNLKITGTKLKTIDVKTYKTMKYCHLEMPKLKRINLIKNTRLEELEISDCNTLKKVDLSKNSRLKKLFMIDNKKIERIKLPKKNKIESFSMKGMKKLKKVNISSLTKVELFWATEIKKIKKIDLSKLQKLYDFEWTNGSLKKINWGKKKGHFVRIIVKRNKLTGKINLKKFPNLLYFHCNHNNYKEITGSKDLVSLNCDYNKNLRKVDMRICKELDGFSALGVKKARIYLCYPELHHGPYLDTKNVTYSRNTGD